MAALICIVRNNYDTTGKQGQGLGGSGHREKQRGRLPLGTPRYEKHGGACAGKRNLVCVGPLLTTGNVQLGLLTFMDAEASARAESYGMTPLMLAADAGDTEAVKLLLDQGANVRARDNGGWSALMWAIDGRSIEIARLLLDRGANLNACDGCRWTALMLAADNDDLEAARFLLEQGACVEMQDKDGWTALRIAEDSGLDEMVDLLCNPPPSKRTRRATPPMQATHETAAAPAVQVGFTAPSPQP